MQNKFDSWFFKDRKARLCDEEPQLKIGRGKFVKKNPSVWPSVVIDGLKARIEMKIQTDRHVQIDRLQ